MGNDRRKDTAARTPRHFLLWCLMLAVVLAAPLFGQPAATRTLKNSEDLARLFIAGRMDQVHAAFTEELQQRLGVEELARMRQSLEQNGGKHLRIQGGRQARAQFPPPIVTAVDVPVDFERAAVNLRFTWSLAGEQQLRVHAFAILPRRASSENAPRPGEIAFIEPSYVKEDAFYHFEIEFGARDWPLKGHVVMPRHQSDAPPVPAVVLLPDAAMPDADGAVGPNKVLRNLALGLGSINVASLRFAQRRDQHPQLERTPYTIEEDILEDAVAAVRALATQPGVDRRRIYLLGHGSGAWAAPEIARRLPPIAGLVLISPPARHDPTTHFARLVERQRLGPDVDAAEWNVLRGALNFLEQGNLNPDYWLHDRPASYWLSLGSLRPYESLKEDNRPVLVFFGGKDPWFGEEEIALWNNLRDERRRRATVIDYRAPLNRWMIESRAGESLPPERAPGHVDRLVIEAIGNFVKK